MEIGQILKDTREQKQLSLDDIQEMTKIQKRYLAAIEEDNLNALPGRFYARAFIKEYALILDLDPDILLQYFDEDDIQPEEETVQYSNLRRQRRERSSSKSSAILSFLPNIIVVLLVIGILFVAWTLTQKALSTNSANENSKQGSDEIIRNVNEANDDSEEESNEKQGDDDEDENDEQQEPVQEIEAEFSITSKGTGSSPQSTMDFTYQGEQVLLSLDVTADTYVALSGGSGKNYYDGLLQPGTEVEDFDVSSEESVFINIGNASGLSVSMNGVKLEYPVDPNAYVHQKLDISLKKTE